MKSYRVFFPILLFSLFVGVSAFCQDEPFTFQGNVMVPMSDGVELAANLFIPKEDGPFPTILIRTPYGKYDEKFGLGRDYASNGYAVVIQDCRGKGDSDGDWDPFRYDRQDGLDTQNWVGSQPWCNGKIGTWGGSYVGWTQWASAPGATKYLTAMLPIVPFTNAYEVMYTGGAYQLALSNGWGTGVAVPKVDMKGISLEEAFKRLPLRTWDDQFGQKVFYLRDWIKHNTYDKYWKNRSIDNHYENVTVPILNIGGWYDIFSKSTLEQIAGVRGRSKNFAMRRNQYCIMGPWTHGVNHEKVGEVDFGKTAKLNLDKIQRDWYEYWLKGVDTGVDEWPPYYLYVMGDNEWRGEHEWPLARTVFTNYYLHGEGDANTRGGDGVLDMDMPERKEPADEFVYDPNDPVPTHGGNNLVGAPAGPYDQQKIEDRTDVLVFTSDELKAPLEITGPVKLMLYASSSAMDTDFTGKLVDVHPDGKAINLCDGIMRARFIDSNADLSLIEPNRVYRFEIDMWVTSNVFLPGHRIRLEVSSSNFPRFDRNPNSGKPFGSDTELLKADQTVYHDRDYPSHLVLPVIPR